MPTHYRIPRHIQAQPASDPFDRSLCYCAMLIIRSAGSSGRPEKG